MDTKPVTRGNDVVLKSSKPCHQTSSVPYSTENRRKLFRSCSGVLSLVHSCVVEFVICRAGFQWCSKLLLSLLAPGFRV